MHAHDRNRAIGRRVAALVTAYLLALQGLLVAWGAVPAVAHAQSELPSILCTAAGESAPVDRSGDQPACCLCGPLCGFGAGPVLSAPPQAEVTTLQRPHAAAKWSIRPFDAARQVSSAPCQARAPPVTA
jgi:hypothetical protein